MMSIMVDNFMKMNFIKQLKDKSALTIVEVMVAMILTAIVMLHGMAFFITTWRLSTESKEYSMILNDVVCNLEKCVSKGFDSSITVIPSGYYMVKTKVLRDKYTVTYTLVQDKSLFNECGFCYIISSATWKYGGDDDTGFNINIKTAIAPKW